ncbi:hypothetical protein CC2G_011178 [Coprinopsis cinerea AmutBmut pab1-1]|nr:hypothetical protein CC2G_011178 [Coprinopsis cinerea AmutBmut pab1-1]
MRARIDFVLKYLKVPTLDSVQSGLDDLLNMLRLCRGDNLGVRDIVPGLYIRLQRDQTCYDFLKWYATEGERGDYDWGDMSLPYLNLKDEDVMEDPVGLFKPEWHASHVVPVLLIKLRMLLDLKDLVASKVLETLALPSEKGPEPKLNFDVLQEIRREIATRSGVWSSRPQLLEPKDLEKRVETLEKQVQWLFVEIHGANKFLWKGMLEHEEWLKITPGPYSHGMQSEALLLVHNNAWSWIETEGAMEWLKQQVAQLG